MTSGAAPSHDSAPPLMNRQVPGTKRKASPTTLPALEKAPFSHRTRRRSGPPTVARAGCEASSLRGFGPGGDRGVVASARVPSRRVGSQSVVPIAPLPGGLVASPRQPASLLQALSAAVERRATTASILADAAVVRQYSCGELVFSSRVGCDTAQIARESSLQRAVERGIAAVHASRLCTTALVHTCT